MTSFARKGSALFLTLLLLLTATACGSPQPDTVVGTWDYEFPSPGSFGGEEGLMQHLTLILREDNTFSFGPNVDKMRPQLERNIDTFVAEVIASEGGTKTAEDFYKENETSREAMVDELLTMMVNAGSGGTYKLDGDKLYLQFEDTDETPDEYYTYAFSEGRLVLTLPEGVTPTFQIAPPDIFPLTLTRGA
ncbi:MAG: hypothetical protein IJD01_00840 [Clostridia bacterium]|nr:hypothetical protein [Clostridia bacterium]